MIDRKRTFAVSRIFSHYLVIFEMRKEKKILATTAGVDSSFIANGEVKVKDFIVCSATMRVISYLSCSYFYKSSFWCSRRWKEENGFVVPHPWQMLMVSTSIRYTVLDLSETWYHGSDTIYAPSNTWMVHRELWFASFCHHSTSMRNKLNCIRRIIHRERFVKNVCNHRTLAAASDSTLKQM